MVFYFTSTLTSPHASIYVGKDKFENEELIKFGWDCDVWVRNFCPFVEPEFHADNLSSAHIYLRMTPEQKWDSLPQDLVEDCAQLTKANSIEGNKKDNVTIIYTPWANLRKDASMATGQVSFKDPKKVKKLLVPTRINASINRLDKTRTLGTPDDLPAAKEAYLKTQRTEKRKITDAKAKEENRVAQERRREKEEKERAWQELTTSGEGGVSNQEGFDEDDFM